MDSLYESKKIASATHNIYAYRISSDEKLDVFYQGCEDDGETQAGSRMLHLMQVLGVEQRPMAIIHNTWKPGISFKNWYCWGYPDKCFLGLPLEIRV